MNGCWRSQDSSKNIRGELCYHSYVPDDCTVRVIFPGVMNEQCDAVLAMTNRLLQEINREYENVFVDYGSDDPSPAPLPLEWINHVPNSARTMLISPVPARPKRQPQRSR